MVSRYRVSKLPNDFDPRLGCFSNSDLLGRCTSPNESMTPPPPPGVLFEISRRGAGGAYQTEGAKLQLFILSFCKKEKKKISRNFPVEVGQSLSTIMLSQIY